MPAILKAIESSPYYQERSARLKAGEKVSFSGLVGSAKSVLAAVLGGQGKDLLIITSSGLSAERLGREMELLTGKSPLIFPSLDLQEETILPSKELIGERLAVLNAWREGKGSLVIAPLKTMRQKTSRTVESIRLAADQEIRIDSLIGKLVDHGYKRFAIVGERGEFSVRGGIVDIFPINADLPIRLELFEDKVESLREFEPFSQRSVKPISEAIILPACEKPEVRIIDLVPAGALVVLDEPLELNRLPEELAAVEPRARAELSTFLAAGEEPFFAASTSYVGQPETLPDRAIIVSKHAPRLKAELPNKEIVAGELRGGFSCPGLMVVTDRELFGEEPAKRRPGKVIKEGVAENLLTDLKIGDYVVHENYGIGLYQGMSELEIEGVKQEYLLIQYAEEAKLFVPPHLVGLVEKYVGGRESRPKLSRLGTRDWLKTRSKVKESLRDMTQELLQLYALRQKVEGNAYPADDIWQKELEATFPYEETPDQAKAIAAVKADLESPRPMDRLICGDVGYGKTEVAIRAAAKAAAAGKQAAFLAPTTILVEQHYNNFKERFKNLPYVVEMLSRFRPKAEQAQVVKALAEGKVDIVIGTHRLLSKDIKFKELGLLIVDEEQKFGVTHKEKLKKLKASVDVLTLTATPIPRTLYFSLSGVRELSLITTPPVDRSPIRTYVIPFSENVIQEAIRRELDRGGQVYFVHNYVETIDGFAARIRRLVPEARVAVGHGQMKEAELEKTMLGFLAGEFDVLVCTSIIESGLDITNVNTILVDQATHFGLSQLYQIRGRVGRSAVRAYAYLFYRPESEVTDEAIERLKAIQEFTALGSGYKLAMRDLEIRGSGNLLGAQQSGHIYEVGFDLYCELLEEAVREIKGEKVTPPREVEIDLKVEASIPADYVTDERQRIALYRRMNLITDAKQIAELKNEFEDRFGKVPPQLATLLRLVELKSAALQAGVKSVKEEGGQIRLEWAAKKVKVVAARGDKIKSALLGIAG